MGLIMTEEEVAHWIKVHIEGRGLPRSVFSGNITAHQNQLILEHDGRIYRIVVHDVTPKGEDTKR